MDKQTLEEFVAEKRRENEYRQSAIGERSLSALGTGSNKTFEQAELTEHMKAIKRAREEEEDSRVFSTGSKRDKNDHKPRIADMKPYTRKRFGYHMLKGSKNYGIGNFELGQPTESSLESIHRHLADYELGDRSEDHLSSILFGIQLIMQNEQKDGDVPADFYYQKYLDEKKEKQEAFKKVIESI